MQNETVLAHISDTGEQSLSKHLLGVSRRTRLLADKLALPRAGALLGLLHDLGKNSELFQTYLKSFDSASDAEPQDELRGKIDHSTAGAQCVLYNLPGGMVEASLAGIAARILALCIASHHSGLIDCLLPEGNDALVRRLSKDDTATRYGEAWRTLDPEIRAEAETLMRDPNLVSELKTKIGLLLHSLKPEHRDPGDRNLQLGLLIRLLFSCLIDADRTDTADFEQPNGATYRQAGRYEAWQVLASRLEAALTALSSKGTEEINRVRGLISAQCLAASSRPPGIYMLTVPTGGGKTLAALRFAMAHAQQHGQHRLIFVSPYISIIDQNAAVARAILEPLGVPFATVVLEHHSNLSIEQEGARGAESWRRKLLAENWDAPVVFTTMVQVLEALFGAGTRAVRRLHAMANAVLVFDEVQTLPIRLVHLFNNALNLLAGHCGSTVLLCTATQPLLDRVNRELGAVRLAAEPELIEDVTRIFEGLRRYTVHDKTGRAGGWSRVEVAALACTEARTHGSCLVVVNTKLDAREIFQLCREELANTAYIAHLSTGMCPAHRTEVLHALKERLKERLADEDACEPVLCISTQLIEAGVDIDFACVIRDLAGLDSIAQAAGRCNRNGLRSSSSSVHIVKLPDLPKSLEEIKKGQQVSLRVLGEWRRAHPGDPFPLDDPAVMRRFYELSFFERRAEMSYSVKAGSQMVRDTTLQDLLGANSAAVEEMRREKKLLHRDLLLQSFKTANEAFAVIGATQGIVVPFSGGGARIVSSLCAAHDLGEEWQLLRKAQPYTLSVYNSQFKRLCDAGSVYEAAKGTGVFCLRPEYYDRAFGLRPEAGPLEELIV
jgi:CRISPR-associated endonuclease/helicase Cas3